MDYSKIGGWKLVASKLRRSIIHFYYHAEQPNSAPVPETGRFYYVLIQNEGSLRLDCGQKYEIRYGFSRISHWTTFKPKRTKQKTEKTNPKNVLCLSKIKKMFETNLIIQKIEWLSDRLDFWQLWFRLAHIKSSVTIFGKPYQGNKLKKNQNETCWLSRRWKGVEIRFNQENPLPENSIQMLELDLNYIVCFY